MLKRLTHSYLGLFGALALILIILSAVFAPWIAPYPEDARHKTNLKRMLRPPSLTHLFGTDDMGRDIFSRVLFGARLSLFIGISSVALASVTGTVLGLIAGYVGGLVDEVIMRIADIFMSVPYVILGMAIAVALSPGVNNVIIAVGLVFWPAFARLMRGEVLSIKEEDYVEASKATGAAEHRIMIVHIVPNCIDPILIQATIQIGWAIMLSATLSFIGVGVQPPLPEWGLMTSTGRRFMLGAWWYATFPGLAIVFTVISFNLIGDYLRDFFDPYQQDVV